MPATSPTILITGGRRVGADLAIRLANRGPCQIVLTYHRSREAILTVAGELEKIPGTKVLAVQADLSQPDQAADVIHQSVTRFGRLDALVNMASIFPRTPFLTLKPDDFDRNIAANLAGPYHTSVAAAKLMLEQPADENGMKGRVVNIGDWATDRPYRDFLPYMIAKGGLKTMTLAMAAELAPFIAVNMIQPAMIAPPEDMTDQDIQDVRNVTPLRRVGTPADVNELILYLLFSTNFVTGSCFRVDGGRFLGENLN